MKLVSFRYLWKLKSTEQINFKIVTDTEEGHNAFVDAVKSLDGLERLGREYICEYDVASVGLFDSLYVVDDEVCDEKV